MYSLTYGDATFPNKTEAEQFFFMRVAFCQQRFFVYNFNAKDTNILSRF